jgi:superfamily II DNA helicase RecQ
MKQKIKNLLKNTFKIEDFRGIQEKAIGCALTQNDFFVIFRSGGGKSLTY